MSMANAGLMQSKERKAIGHK